MSEEIILSAKEIHRLPTLRVSPDEGYIPISVNLGVSGYKLYKISAKDIQKLAAQINYDEFQLREGALLADSTVFYADFFFIGQAIEDGIFGIYRPDDDYKLVGMEMSAQEGPVGDNLTVELVTEAGSSTGQSITILDGSEYAISAIPNYQMLEDSVWRFKITNIGSTDPGDTIQLRLSLKKQND